MEMRYDGRYVVYAFVGCGDFCAHPTSVSQFSFSRENSREMSVKSYIIFCYTFHEKYEFEELLCHPYTLFTCTMVPNRQTTQQPRFIYDSWYERQLEPGFLHSLPSASKNFPSIIFS
jgi:hypothetical protein